MSLFITSLNSGSNGNCYYVGNDEEAVLIDAGISCREVEKRMKRLGLVPGKIKGIFVSHEHSDHISGIAALSKKFRIPVYLTRATFECCGLGLDKELVVFMSPCNPVVVGSLSVTGFAKYHDAKDPLSFMVTGNDIRVGVFTDLGIACETVVSYFKQCHAAFLEANYDDEMLANGSYPHHLKKRIRGKDGHLSNAQALQLFLSHKPSCMSHLVLSHLSKNNNCPELVKRLFNQHAGGTEIIVASRYEETPVFQLDVNSQPVTYSSRIYNKQPASQLSLF